MDRKECSVRWKVSLQSQGILLLFSNEFDDSLETAYEGWLCLHRGFLGVDGQPGPLGCIFSVCVIPLTIFVSFPFFLNNFAVCPDTEQSEPPTGPLPRLHGAMLPSSVFFFLLQNIYIYIYISSKYHILMHIHGV